MIEDGIPAQSFVYLIMFQNEVLYRDHLLVGVNV